MPAILIIKTSSLGDVVHNLPIVADIVRHVPDAQIDWVVEEAFADVPAMHPSIRNVIPVALRRWRRRLLSPSTWREIRRVRHALRANRYDLVLDTQGLLKSAMIAVCANGPTAGQDAASARESLAARFYRRTFTVARGRHAVLRNRDLAAQAVGYGLPHTPPDYGLSVPVVPDLALPSRYVVCLHATSWASKQWPETSWIELGLALRRQETTVLLPWGNDEEKSRAERIAAQVSGAIVLPKLNLRALAAILQQAQAVIGVDTGLVHLAVALARPTVAIYIDTYPHLTGLLATDPRHTASLGGKGHRPDVSEVLQALAKVGSV